MYHFFSSYEELALYFRRKFIGVWKYWKTQEIPIQETTIHVSIQGMENCFQIQSSIPTPSFYWKILSQVFVNHPLQTRKNPDNLLEFQLNIPFSCWEVSEDFASVQFAQLETIHQLEIQAMQKKRCYLYWTKTTNHGKELVFASYLDRG